MTGEFEEIRREIDFQIETYRQHQETAQVLLRILLAVVGLILTAVSFAYSQSRGDITSIVSNDQLNEFSNQLRTNYPLSGQQADIVILLVLITYIGILAYASYNLFGRTSAYLLRVISPSVFEPNISNNNLSRTDIDERTAEAYREIIEKNSVFIEKSQSNLDKALESIQTGVWSFLIASSGVVAPLIVDDPLFILTAALTNGLVIGVLFLRSLNWKEVRRRLFLERRLDPTVVLVSLTLIGITGTTPDIPVVPALLLVILLIALLTPIYHGLVTPTHRAELIIERQGLLFLVIMAGFLLTRFMSLGNSEFRIVSESFAFVFLVTLYATTAFGIGHTPRYGFIRIGRFIRRNAPSPIKKFTARMYKWVAKWAPLPPYLEMLALLDDGDQNQ